MAHPHHTQASWYTYMVIIRPPEPVTQKVRRLKSRLQTGFDLNPLQLQGGYVLLSRFVQVGMPVQKLLDRIRPIAMEAAPFKVQMEDFFWLPDHSMGVQISNPAGLQTLIQGLKKEYRLFKAPGCKPYFNHYPAMGIASRLQPAQYQAIHQQYRFRQFTASFIASHLTIIRKAANGAQWTVLEDMPLQNIPVRQIRQGVLFV